MYKLLVVDDEPEIADSIFELLQTDYTRHELELYKCYSGEDALKILSRIRMDIVITDINMPCFSGFNLVEEINRSWKFCQIIFLTGFSSQDYLRTAINYNNVQYVLKNEPDQILLNAVTHAVDNINQAFDNAAVINSMKKIIGENMPILRRELITQMVKSKIDLCTLREKSNQLGVDIDFETQTMLVMIMIHERMGSDTGLQTEIYLKSLVMRQFPQGYKINLELIDTDTFVCILQSDGLSFSVIKNITEEIHSQVKSIFNISASVMLTQAAFAVPDMGIIYKNMRNLYFSSPNHIEGEFITFDNEETENSHLLPPSVINLSANELEILLEKSDLKGIEQFLDNAREYVSTAKNRFEAKQVMSDITLQFMKYVNKYHLYEHERDSSAFRALYDEEQFETQYHKLAFLKDFAGYILHLKKTDYENDNLSLYNKLVAYIENHLQEDLTLSSLSDQIHFNPSYISRQFKSFCGINLNDYITNKRLEKAQKLLLGSDLKVWEIAVSVGYDTTTYFNRVFKKHLGVTPLEFRMNRK